MTGVPRRGDAAPTGAKDPAPETGSNEETAAERRQRIRGRNLATLAVLLGLVVLFYLVTIVRMGGS